MAKDKPKNEEQENLNVAPTSPVVQPAEEVKLEDTPEFKDLVDNNSLSDLKEMLIAEGMVGAEFIDNKKVAAAAIITFRKRKEERSAPAPEVQSQATNVPSSASDRLVMNNWKRKAQAMKELCAKAEKVKIMIPFDIGERPGAYAELQINGYKLSVMKGIYVEVPEPFANLVQESWKQTLEAGQEYLLDRIDPATGKPMSESQALV